MEDEEILEELETLEVIDDDEGAEFSSPKSDEEPFEKFRQRKNSRRLPPLLRLTRRANVFLSFTLIATIIFFVTGNKQIFLDSNMSLILKIIACTAISLSIFSFSAIIECIFYTVKDKKFRLIFHLVSYILIFLASTTISILSLTINLLSEGIDF